MRRDFHGAFLNIMKKYYPSYYDEFSCIAGDCPDSCCRKWEIVIDSETLNKYNALTCDFSEKIRSEIIKDEEGDCCFRLKGGNCPFLNSQGLCDIHISLGEDYTSEICRNHPRFIEEYDGFTEISLSLSCPEANRIILSSDSTAYPAPDYSGDDEVLELLISSRKALLDEQSDYSALINKLLDTAADDSLDIDLVYVAEHPDFNIGFLKSFADILLNKCEILTEEWKELLKISLRANVSDKDFQVFCKENNNALVRILHYYIYRYYLKAVNDLDVYSRALFIAVSCLFSAYIAFTCDAKLSESARLYSKETEHNLDNIDILLNFFSEF